MTITGEKLSGRSIVALRFHFVRVTFRALCDSRLASMVTIYFVAKLHDDLSTLHCREYALFVYFIYIFIRKIFNI